jgi:DNA repair exonuclease SbcCD ATPase subunit
MLPEFIARLSKIIEQKRRKKKLEQDLLAVEAELQETAPRLSILGAQLDKEKIDVQKLERTSLATLFYAVLGSREEQLEKERQEMLSVQLQYQQTKHQVEYLEGEQAFLNEQLEKLGGVEVEYDSLLSEKETFLRGSNQAVASQLIEYAEQSANLASEVKELSEAIQAGRDVSSSLEQVLDSLESAKGWGTWDMLGGGLLSTAVKHSRIDDARQGIHDVQAKMSQFKRELADVRERIELTLDIGEFETFADYFFDGLIVDWIVQSKITESLERAQNAQDAIAQAIEELENLKQNAQKVLNDLQEKRTQLIERT